jgi:ubiquinone/menaquinone biosynthesis C-methylase UbiE
MASGAPPNEVDQTRIERERLFWDEHARESLAGRPLEDYRTGPDDRYDRTVPWLPYIGMPEYIEQVLAEIGDVTGKSVLDLGTGSGFLAALLAARGAQVDAVDVSDASLDLAQFRAKLSGVADRVRLHNMPVESLSFPANSFDSVAGLFLLHHLDLASSLAGIHRVLRPGGVAAFVETSARNKLLMAARSTLTGRFGIEKAGSEDEAPLGREARRIIASSGFSGVRYCFPNLLCFRMAGYMPWARVGPLPSVWRGLDTVAGMIPGLRSYSYFVVVVLRK